mmetsp:Transcript_318/g.526  ORF Transcript_318/g.526 Transcript_318/m.526 type:complete len:211 (+) Transcript_318:180-812(+)
MTTSCRTCRRSSSILFFSLMVMQVSMVTAFSILSSIIKNKTSPTTKNNKVDIRPAKLPEDLEGIRECRLSDEEIASSASFINDAFLNAKAMTTGESVGIIAKEKSRPYRVLGTIELSLYEKSNKALIRNVYVREDARGMGLGNQLMEAAEDMVKTEQLGKVVLDVDTNNIPAVSMYRKLGYDTPGIHMAMSSLGKVPGLNIRIRMAKTIS